jgi:hypothetical protein
LQHAAARLRGRRAWQNVRSLAGGTVAALLVVGLVWAGAAYFRPPEEIPRISCHECRQRLPDYLAGTLAEPLAKQVEQHLGHCRSCRRLHEKMLDRPGVVSLDDRRWLDKPLCDRLPGDSSGARLLVRAQ